MNFASILPGWRRFWAQELLPTLADLRLAILLLLSIALFSIAGTVIEQGQPVGFYQANYPEKPALFGFLTWRVLVGLGLNRVYSTWWFLALLILFGASLTACTFTRQIPALKAAWHWKFYDQPRQFQKLALSTTLVRGQLPGVAVALRQRGYRVFEADNFLYARKGLVGRWGPILVHGSMLLILAGSIWGSLGGFMDQEMIPQGETLTFDHPLERGVWARVPHDWSVRVNRFWIEYTPDGHIDQFYSDLSVLDQDQQEVKHQTIHVNQPLRYRGVTLYQADWGIAAVQVRVNQSPVLQLPMAVLSGVQGRIWGSWIPTQSDLSAGVSLVAKDLQGMLLAYDGEGKLIATVRRGMAVDLQGVTLAVVDLVGSTGLQIKADPGVPLVYLGFGLLMAGVVMSYFSHSQVWGLETSEGGYLGGRTNRAQVLFERELMQILSGLTLAEPAVAPSPESGKTD